MNTVDYLLKFIGKEKLDEIDMYLMEAMSSSFRVFKTKEEIEQVLGGYLDNFLGKLSYEEQGRIKEYTGLSFRRINSILRHTWNYEVNGRLTPEIRKESEEAAEAIRTILMKSVSLPEPICVFRGASLSQFYQYGITKFEDLPLLKDRFIYEDGFTSTSLLRDTSFFYKPTECGEKATIEIEYLIPGEADDGALINCSSLSYSPEQNEYLITSGSLFKVIDVDVFDNKTAMLYVTLVPQKVWNPYVYEREREDNLGK